MIAIVCQISPYAELRVVPTWLPTKRATLTCWPLDAKIRRTFARLRERGVEFIQETIACYGNVDANFRDASGNGWKIIQEGA